MRFALSLIAMLWALLWSLAPGSVFAHAFLEKAAPAVGGTVNAAPKGVTLWFTQELEPAFSTIRVEGADGKRVDLGDARVDGAVFSVSLPQLPPGTYKVYWRVVSVDAHVTEGDFAFEIAP
jgi:methionine-rich copper-binding protein CopC